MFSLSPHDVIDVNGAFAPAPTPVPLLLMVPLRCSPLLLCRPILCTAEGYLALMFLCLVEPCQTREFHFSMTFAELFENNQPQEIAKLKMFLHFFTRTRAEPPRGIVRFARHALTAEEREPEAWLLSSQPMVPVEIFTEGSLEDPKKDFLHIGK